MSKGTGACTERASLTKQNLLGGPVKSLLEHAKLDELKSRGRGGISTTTSKTAADGARLYEQTVAKNKVLSYETQRKLILIAQDPLQPEHERDRARKAVALSNQRWIIAQAYSSYFKGRGVTCEDLVQAGNEGLMESIDQYDPELGNTFITFAKHKIFMRMQRHSEEDSANVYGARLPSDRYSEVVKVHRAVKRLGELYQRDPSLEELVNYLKNNPDDSKSAKKLTPARIEFAWKWLKNRPVSMQAKLRSDDGETLEFGSHLKADSPDPSQVVINNDFEEMIGRAFTQLNEQEKLVVGSYLGYGNYHHVPSLNQIARQYNLKTSLVSSIYTRARNKMQRYFESQGITRETLVESGT